MFIVQFLRQKGNFPKFHLYNRVYFQTRQDLEIYGLDSVNWATCQDLSCDEVQSLIEVISLSQKYNGILEDYEISSMKEAMG